MITRKIYYKDESLEIKKQCYHKSRDNMPTHTHDFLTISLVLEGCLFERSADLNNFAQSGALSIKPPNLLHSDIFTEDCTILSLKILDWKYYELQFDDWEWISDSMTLKYFLQIIQSKNKKESMKIFKEFLINQFQLKKNTHKIPDWLATTHQILHQNFQENLPIAELAKEVGKHPVHLARTFQLFYGIDIKNYQKHLRIQQALSETLAQNKNLTQVAYSNGFADQSHFSREFKKLTGISPKKVITLLDV